MVKHFIFSGIGELREERNLAKAWFVLNVASLLKSISLIYKNKIEQMLVRSFVSIMSSSVVSGVQNKIVCDHRKIQARHMSQAYFIIVNQADLIKNINCFFYS